MKKRVTRYLGVTTTLLALAVVAACTQDFQKDSSDSATRIEAERDNFVSDNWKVTRSFSQLIHFVEGVVFEIARNGDELVLIVPRQTRDTSRVLSTVSEPVPLSRVLFEGEPFYCSRVIALIGHADGQGSSDVVDHVIGFRFREEHGYLEVYVAHDPVQCKSAPRLWKKHGGRAHAEN